MSEYLFLLPCLGGICVYIVGALVRVCAVLLCALRMIICIYVRLVGKGRGGYMREGVIKGG